MGTSGGTYAVVVFFVFALTAFTGRGAAEQGCGGFTLPRMELRRSMRNENGALQQRRACRDRRLRNS